MRSLYRVTLILLLLAIVSPYILVSMTALAGLAPSMDFYHLENMQCRGPLSICNMMLLLRRENGIIIHGELFSIMNRIGIGGATLLSPIFCSPKFRVQKQNAKLELL